MPDAARVQAAEDRLQTLRARFTRTLEMRVLDLDASVQRWTVTGDVAALREIAHIAHKLAGVCGSFGYCQLGDEARLLDELVTTGMAGAQVEGWQKTAVQKAEGIMDRIESILDE